MRNLLKYINEKKHPLLENVVIRYYNRGDLEGLSRLSPHDLRRKRAVGCVVEIMYNWFFFHK